MKKRTRLLLILVAALCLCLGFGVFAACKNEPKKHVHEYTAWAHDGTYHWKVCPVDDAEDESTREEHTMVDGKCTVCDYEEAPPAHTHAYTDLVSDATNHWYECPEDNDYITQFGHIYGEDGKCIVCKKEGTAPTGVELDEREWYVVGSGSGDLFTHASWTELQNGAKFTKAEKPDANGYTVYTYQMKLYSGDEFKLVQDLMWDNGLGYFSYSDLANGSAAFRDAGGGNITPQKGHDGIYQFIIRTKPTSGATAAMVEWNLIEAVDPLNVPEQYEMYVIGNMKATGKNNWSTTPSQMLKLDLMSDGETFYVVVELFNDDTNGIDAFKLYNVKSKSYYPSGENNNINVSQSGIYVITWKVGALTPTVELYHHIHNYLDWAHDDAQHWNVCGEDGEAAADAVKTDHAFGNDNFCDVCGYEKTDKPECETHTWGTDNVCTVCGRHWIYSDGLRYKINDKRDGYYLAGLHEDTDPAAVTEIVAPYYYNGRPVIGVAENAFSGGSATIQKVVLPDTVKTIGKNAFKGLTGLLKVEFGAGLEEIGESAFESCSHLESAKLPEGVKTIGAKAFYKCSVCREVVLPATLTALGNSAFEEAGVIYLTIAEGSNLASIGASAFRTCKYLDGVVLPEGLETIGEYAFSGCIALKKINVPATVKSMDWHVFDGCTLLTSLEFAAPENWEYAAFDDKNNWILLDAAMLGDPAAAAEWFKDNRLDYFRTYEAHEHDFALRYDATYHWYRCQTCAAISDKEMHEVDADMICKVCRFEHTEHQYERKILGDSGHQQTCKICGATQALEAHRYNVAYTCTTCRYSHKHVIDEETWLSDETDHWHPGLCGHITGKYQAKAHTFGDDNICKTCGYERIVQGENNGTPGLAFEFNEEYTGLIVTGFKEVPADATEIVIPANCGTWSVLEVAAEAFKDAKLATVKKVVIPDTVKIVREGAFRGLTGLDDLTIGSSVYKIEQYAFAECTALPAVTLPESLKTLPQYAFNGCTALASINLDKLTDIGRYAFQNCAALDNIKFSEELTVVRNYTFDGCTSLNTIDFGGVTQIGEYELSKDANAFRNCGFVNLTLPENLSFFGQGAFQGCLKLTTLKMPLAWDGSKQSKEGPGTYGFDGCTSLATVDFNGCTYLPSYIFRNCGFVSLTLPADMRGNASIFEGNLKLKTLTLEGTTVGGGSAFKGCTALETITYTSKTLTTIGFGNETFTGCTALTTVNLPAQVTEMTGYRSFYGCTLLKNVDFSNIQGILGATNLFSYTGFETLSLPKLVSFLNGSTTTSGPFSNCVNLKSVSMPLASNVVSTMFFNCTNLTSVELNPALTKIDTSAFSGCTSLAEITIPSTVTAIGGSAFKGTAITTITIPAGVTKIDSSTFEGCAQLATVNFGTAQIAEIGNSAFKGCTVLDGVTLPATVAKLGTNVFQNCTTLKAITIPEKVTALSNYSFDGCAALATVNFGTAQIASIGNYAFRGCAALDNVTLPETITSLGTYVFQNCTSLKAITIPEKVTALGNYSFDGCTQLATVNLGAGVKTIGTYAFQNCTALTTITIPAQVDTISVTAFKGAGLTEVTFAEAADWLVASSATATTGTAVKDDLTDKEAAATLLKENSESTSKYFRRVPKA